MKNNMGKEGNMTRKIVFIIFVVSVLCSVGFLLHQYRTVDRWQQRGLEDYHAEQPDVLTMLPLPGAFTQERSGEEPGNKIPISEGHATGAFPIPVPHHRESIKPRSVIIPELSSLICLTKA